MELFDFYKLLNIPVGTSFEDVKKAYILKVHEYSGAYNDGDDKASEYLKVITDGYKMLSDPDKKRVYDLMLLRHQLKHKNSEINKSMYRKYGDSDRNPIKDEGEIADFENEHSTPAYQVMTPEKEAIVKRGIRNEITQIAFGGLLLVVMSMFYNLVYWMPYTDEKMVSFVLLIVTYIIVMLWLLSKVYRFFEVRNLIHKNKLSTEKWVITMFIILFFGAPIGAWRFENLRRTFHMNHYAAKVRASDFMLEDYWFTAVYKVDGHVYRQSVSLGDGAETFKNMYYDREKFWVKYSTKNPKIMEIVTDK